MKKLQALLLLSFVMVGAVHAAENLSYGKRAYQGVQHYGSRALKGVKHYGSKGYQAARPYGAHAYEFAKRHKGKLAAATAAGTLMYLGMGNRWNTRMNLILSKLDEVAARSSEHEKAIIANSKSRIVAAVVYILSKDRVSEGEIKGRFSGILDPQIRIAFKVAKEVRKASDPQVSE